MYDIKIEKVVPRDECSKHYGSSEEVLNLRVQDVDLPALLVEILNTTVPFNANSYNVQGVTSLNNGTKI